MISGENIIHGKSGCKIDVVNKDYNFILRKTSPNISYNRRLILQSKKQKEFRNRRIKVPYISNIFDGGMSELSFVEMYYVLGDNMINFLIRCSPTELNDFVDNLLYYLECIIIDANPLLINQDPIKSKIESFESTNFENKDSVLRSLKNIPEEKLLVGDCHGDLTFSNIIHTQSAIYFIDFLDSFVNSPIVDLIKIRQDTKHLWTVFLSKNTSYRILISLKYIDDIIRKKYGWLIETNWYRYLSLFNYIRIYPYVSNKQEESFIKECINQYL
jgi:hypothetical protein